MNKADEIKELVAALIVAERALETSNADSWSSDKADVEQKEQKLHAAIDAQQEEIERLTKLLEPVEVTDEEALEMIECLGRHDAAVKILQAGGYTWAGGEWISSAGKEPPCN